MTLISRRYNVSQASKGKILAEIIGNAAQKGDPVSPSLSEALGGKIPIIYASYHAGTRTSSPSVIATRSRLSVFAVARED